MYHLQICRGLLLSFLLTGVSYGRPSPISTLTDEAPTSLCPFKTINYITHTLPQQCLRTNWVSPTLHSPSTRSSTSSIPSHSQGRDSLDKHDPRGGHGHLIPSFEEWKALMLQQHGEDTRDAQWKNSRSTQRGEDAHSEPSADISKDESDSPHLQDRKDPQSLSEYDEPLESPHRASHEESVEILYDDGKTQYYRSKDAGKTCKERFSYSSFDAGATILKTSPGTKNAKAILLENKDSYMLFECQTEAKYVIVELSDDILVDTFVLANFEFFSSMVRHFRASLSDRYPVKAEKWHSVGTFEAKNSRDIQAFLVEDPKIWARYVKVEFLTHYGNEYYCPVSLLRVHGTRMMESWKDAEPSLDEEDALDTSIPVEIGAAAHQEESVYSFSSGGEPNFSHVLNLFEMANATCPILPETSTWNLPSTNRTGSPPTQWRPRAATPSQTGTGAPINVPQGTISTPSVSIPVATPHTSIIDSSIQANGTIMISYDGLGPGGGGSSPQPKPPDTATIHQKDRAGTAGASVPTPPIVQDSFFKTVTRRLQLLESNVTWTLKYVEDQSRFIHDAFFRMEERLLPQVESFTDAFNHTIRAELETLRQQYDQIWQSTILALETQREQSQSELVALSSRLNVLADEVVFQKRMSIGQSILLLSCLVLIIFSRSMALPSAPSGSQSGIDTSTLPQVNQLSYDKSSQLSLNPRLTPPAELPVCLHGGGDGTTALEEVHFEQCQAARSRDHHNSLDSAPCKVRRNKFPWSNVTGDSLLPLDNERLRIDAAGDDNMRMIKLATRARKPLPPLPE